MNRTCRGAPVVGTCVWRRCKPPLPDPCPKASTTEVYEDASLLGTFCLEHAQEVLAHGRIDARS